MTGALLIVALAALNPQQTAVTPQKPPATVQASGSQSTSSTDLPVSLDRIERALASPPPVELKEQHPVFRVEIYGRKPTLEDILGEKFWVGPIPYAGMTHQEFMAMNTPKQLQPYAVFSGKYLASAAALTLAEQWALKQAIHKFREARTTHEREAARKEVLDSLAELEKARKAAGLDK